MSQEAPRPGSRQPDIEALRALAALAVVMAHLPWYRYFPDGVWPDAPRWLAYKAPLLGIGGLAVVVFLVISGAGLCRMLVLKPPKAVPYLRARLGRLFGVFWAAAIPIAAISFAIGWQPLSQAWNVLLVLLGLGFVSKASWAALFPSWWYMAIAWQVVLAVPLIVWGMRRIRPVGVLALTVAVVLIGCLALPMLGMQYDGEKSLVVGRALEVLGGAFLAFGIWPDVREKMGVSGRQALVLVVATVAILAAMYFVGLGGRWLYRAAGLGLTAVIAYWRPLERLGAVKLSAFAVAAGGTSFAVYILHEPLMLLVRGFTGAPDRISVGSLAVVSLAVVLPLAVLFDKAVDAVVARMGGREGGREGTGG